MLYCEFEETIATSCGTWSRDCFDRQWRNLTCNSIKRILKNQKQNSKVKEFTVMSICIQTILLDEKIYAEQWENDRKRKEEEEKMRDTRQKALDKEMVRVLDWQMSELRAKEERERALKEEERRIMVHTL
jgi:hypothetical protein